MRNLFRARGRKSPGHRGGLAKRWLALVSRCRFDNTLTPFGQISVRLQPVEKKGYSLTLDANWRGEPPPLSVQVPGYRVPVRRGKSV